ncbi:integrase arm-type DNA-binding domain-containing protein [Pragia fontium]
MKVSKPKEKAYKLSDGGLYLLINPNGSKYWGLKYRIAGKEKLLAMGGYPAVFLASARKKRDDAREIIAAGGDLNETKKTERAELKATIENTFESVAREWHEYKCPNWTKGYASELLEGLQKDIFPHIGRAPPSCRDKTSRNA